MDTPTVPVPSDLTTPSAGLSSTELEEIAAELDVVPAPACSALVREAAAAYVRRGVIA